MRRPSVLLSGLLLVTSLMAAAAPAAAAAPKTRWVDDDGLAGPRGCNGIAAASKGIQRAVNRSAVGDIVKVCPGTYVGRVKVATNRVQLIAVKTLTATIKAPPTMPGGNPLVELDARGTRLDGFRLQAPTEAPCGRVGSMVSVFQANKARVLNVRTEPIGAESLGDCGYVTGISVGESTGVQIQGGIVVNFQGGGVNLGGAVGFLVQDLEIAYEHAGQPQPGDIGHVGLIVQSGSTGTVQRVTVSTLGTAGTTSPLLDEGITLRGTASLLDSTVGRTSIGIGLIGSGVAATVDGNTVTNSASTAILASAGVSGATISDNTISGADEYGIRVTGSTGNTFTGNTVSGSGVNDCFDDTSGSGTQNTGNTWAASNHGPQDFPNGICPAT